MGIWTNLLNIELSAHKNACKFIAASMLGGGRDKIPCLKGEQNLAGFRVKRLPSVLSFGTYKVPVT